MGEREEEYFKFLEEQGWGSKEDYPDDWEFPSFDFANANKQLRKEIYASEAHLEDPDSVQRYLKVLNEEHKEKIYESRTESQKEDGRKIDYRFNKALYQSNKKLCHIQDFQRCGLLMDKSNGGNFLSGDHKNNYANLEDLLGNLDDGEIKFMLSDFQAYSQWFDGKSNDEMPDFESFAIKYLNVGKVDSITDTRCRAIATSDNMPCTRFEDWIKDDYAIAMVQGMKYDKVKKLFLPRVASASEIQAERAKRQDIEDELGREVKFI